MLLSILWLISLGLSLLTFLPLKVHDSLSSFTLDVPSVSEQAKSKWEEKRAPRVPKTGFDFLPPPFHLSFFSHWLPNQNVYLIVTRCHGRKRRKSNSELQFEKGRERNKLTDVAVSLFTQFPCLSPPPSFCDRISSFYPLSHIFLHLSHSLLLSFSLFPFFLS